MDKALRMKEKQETLDKEVAEIKQKNFEAFKERCRVDVAKKGETMDFLGRIREERREAIQEENILRAQEAGELLPKQIEQTRKLAEGVLRLKNKEISEQKYRQVLRTRNIELMELEARLKSTYVAKAAQVQLREREASRDEEKYLERRANALRTRWYNDETFYRQVEMEKVEKKTKYRNDIQDQMINNEISRHQSTEDNHRERKIVEEVGQVLDRENMQLDRERRERIAHVRAEREAFFRAKETWKCKEKEALLDEFNRQAKIIADKMTEEKNLMENRADQSAARDTAMEKTARRMLDEEVERREREDLLKELSIQEHNNELVKGTGNDLIKKEIVKRELIDDMKRQKQIVRENEAKAAAVDCAFGKYLAEEYEANVRRDREENDQRRRKGIQYGEELRAICQEQRASYAQEILVRQAVRRQDEKLELQRLDEVALERSKILYEHAPKLRGFLRAGILRPEDYEYAKSRECNPEKC